MRRCDGVKFARLGANQDEAEAGVLEAEALGGEIVTALAPPPEEPASPPEVAP